jgi:hypothetical protein
MATCCKATRAAKMQANGSISKNLKKISLAITNRNPVTEYQRRGQNRISKGIKSQQKQGTQL